MPFIIKAILSGIGSFASKLLLSMLTEKAIANIFFLIAGRYVKSTKTDFDNKMLEEMKDAYNQKPK